MPNHPFLPTLTSPLIYWLRFSQPRSRRGWGAVSLLACGAIASVAQSATAAALTSWQYDPTTNQLEVMVQDGTTPKHFVMAQPARIVLDLPNTEMGDVQSQAAFSGGAVRQVRVSQFQPGVTRFVLELNPDIELAPEQVKLEAKGDRVVVQPVIAHQSGTAAATIKPISSKPVPPKTIAPATPPTAAKAEPALPPPPVPASLPAATTVAVPPVAPSVPSLPPSQPTPSPALDELPRSQKPGVPLAEGSDVSPVTEMMMPPLTAGKAAAPVSVPPSTTVAQLPPEATTPLPPDATTLPTSTLPSPNVTLEAPNAVTIAVPPPVSLPAAPAVTAVPVKPVAPGQAVQLTIPQPVKLVPPPTAIQLTVPAPVTVPKPPTEVVIEAPTKIAVPPPQSQPVVVPGVDIPSTVRSQPTSKTPQITVPALPQTTPRSAANAPAPASVTPPAPLMVPPLHLPPAPPPVSVPQVARITQSVGTPTHNWQTTTIEPVPAQTSAPSLPQPAPHSWVFQPPGSPLPEQTSVPPATATPPLLSSVPNAMPPMNTAPPPLTHTIPAPSSWVMQSSGLSQPSLEQPLQPPVSSVIQPLPASQPDLGTVGSGSMGAPLPSSQPLGTGSMQLTAVPPATVQPPIVPPTSVQAPVLQATALPTSQPDFPASAAAVTVPPLTPTGAASPTPTVTVPPLASPGATAPLPAATVAPAPGVPSQSGVVEFGQPLPTQGATALNTTPQGIPMTPPSGATSSGGWVQPAGGVVQSRNPAIALATGNILNLSYAGTTAITLDPAIARQDMMVLQTEVRDAAGNVIFPRGSYVMGQFETTGSGARFMASSIQRGDRIVPFFAESEPLGGNREISTTSMAIYSGAGALAGGLVTKSGWGALLGGAAGAATNYLTTPKTGTVIQPGQMIQVRMLRDVPY